MYLTIQANSTFEQTIKKSQFICYLIRIQTEDDAKKQLEQLKSQHKKATHVCFAYLLGAKDEIQRESDNGEPQGTAGVPILDVLKNNHLHDVLAVVVRYFGGIKLGAGGLIRAYSSSCAKAIAQNTIVKRVVQNKLSLTLSYALLGKLQDFLNRQKIAVLDTQFTEDVCVTVCVDQAKADAFITNVNNLLSAKATIKNQGDVLTEVPI